MVIEIVHAMAAEPSAIKFIAEDLAPGDRKALELDRRELQVTSVRSEADRRFALAYDALWAEFGAANEMESRTVILRRLTWHPAMALDAYWLRYELILVQHQERLAAVRDHTAIISRQPQPQAVVHLSHVLIDPAWRRTGLGGWLRAWPIQTARAGLVAAGLPADSPITLVGEMEHPDATMPNRAIRLAAYEKAGFKKVAPDRVSYFQPDFRTPAEIDATGGPQPLPFGLVIRRIGREQEESIGGAEVRQLVTSIYQMYATGFRPQDMTQLWQSLQDYPPESAEIPLVPVTR